MILPIKLTLLVLQRSAWRSDQKNKDERKQKEDSVKDFN